MTSGRDLRLQVGHYELQVNRLEFFVEPDHRDHIIKGALPYLRIGKPVIPLCPADDAGVSRRHNEECRHPRKAPLISNLERYATSEVNRGNV